MSHLYSLSAACHLPLRLSLLINGEGAGMARQVCIIGGGVIGLASAYALVRAGHEVTVIDAARPTGQRNQFRQRRATVLPLCRAVG